MFKVYPVRYNMRPGFFFRYLKKYLYIRHTAVMNIHFISPFSIDKNLGKAYNNTIKNLPITDWVCVMDYDAMLLDPNQVKRMYEYIQAYPDATLFVCYGSRVKDGVPQQYLFGRKEQVATITDHINIARNLLAADNLSGALNVKQVNRSVAGFLMLFSVETWRRFPFDEGRKCLTVDTNFSKRILRAGGKILLMESIYVWHTYRLLEGKQSIKHLL